jgi:excisionase family DNA binding protein
MLRDRNTVRMVAEHFVCSPDTIYRLIKRGELACLRIGGVVRVTREHVEAFEAQRESRALAKPDASNAEGFTRERNLQKALETARRQRFGGSRRFPGETKSGRA